jgi:large subunit ribosomal protein L3
MWRLKHKKENIMLQGLLGKKIGMSRIFDEEGGSIPVTLIACGQCYVVDKMESKLKIGFEIVKEKSLNRPQLQDLKKKDLPALKHIKEVKWLGSNDDMPEVGCKIGVDMFTAGQRVNVQGISKGKGTAGVMKRWNMKGGPSGHGSGFHRSAGSIGQASSPSRVFPGLKMAGRMGFNKKTVKNLQVVSVDTEEQVIAIKGAVPGPRKSLVFIQRMVTGK